MTKAHHVHGLECCVGNVPESLMFVDMSFEITIHRSYTLYALDTLLYIHQTKNDTHISEFREISGHPPTPQAPVRRAPASRLAAPVRSIDLEANLAVTN